MSTAVQPLAEVMRGARRLRFADPAMEERFARAHLEEGMLRIRLGVGSAVVFGVLSAVMEEGAYAAWPEGLAFNRLIRWGVQVPVWSALLALTWWPPARRTLDLWIGFAVLVAGVTTVPWHTGWMGGSNPGTGLLLGTMPTLLLATLILPVRWRMMLVMVFSQAVACPLLYAWLGRPGTEAALQGALFQNTWYCAVALIAARLREANDRRLFGQREHLAALNDAMQRLNADLVLANRQKDRLFAVIGHDIRGPLAAIALGSTVLARGTTSDPRARAGEIHVTARRLHTLLQNLLDWARLQEGRPGSRPEPVALAEVAGEAAALHETVAAHGGVRVEVRVPPDLVVPTDRHLVATILRNLVGNAVRATPPGRSVHVASAPDGGGGGWLLSVTDAGPGLGEDRLRELGLQRGEPGPPEPSPRSLGLVVCREYAAALGGALWAEPAPGGAGLRVTLALPRNNAPDAG